MKTKQNAIQISQTGEIIVQTPMPPITCLTLEGGGSRCAAYAGLYKASKICGFMDSVLHVSGCSGGSIGALAIALGLDSKEATEIMLSLKMEELLEGKHQLIPNSNLWSLGRTAWTVWRNDKHALASGDEILKWMESIVEQKLGSAQATFQDLANRIKADKEKNGKSNFKYLYVNGTNLTLEIPECKNFNHETTPNMPIAKAIRISAGIPLIFDLVEFEGAWYADGGLMQNLPSIFDERRFIPEGYDFTDKGTNPAVLTVKVDTQTEINQILWGIVKEIDLSTASAVLKAVYTALAQNTDTNEIRNSRMTLALPDNNISSFEFSVDSQGMLNLISGAEAEAQNFFENYYQAAYDVRTYKNKLEWLNALTLDELDEVIYAYQKMYDGFSEAIVEDKRTQNTFDPNHPTLEEIKTYLIFLNHYFSYKRKLIRDPHLQFEGDVPSFHINLQPEIRDQGFSKNIANDMKSKLIFIEKQISYARKRMYMLSQILENVALISAKTHLRDPDHFDDVQAYTSFEEYLKILRQERREIKVKLGINLTEKKYNAEQSKKCAEFFQQLNPYIALSNPPGFLKAILGFRFPIVMFDTGGYFKKMVFRYDVLNEYDRKCFILAACYFLKYFKAKEQDIFDSLYLKQVSEEKPLPSNLLELSGVLKLCQSSLLIAAYRIEELIRQFELVSFPNQRPSLTLDMIYKLPVLKPNANNRWVNDKEPAIEMHHVTTSYNIFSKNYEPRKGRPAHHVKASAQADVRQMLIDTLKADKDEGCEEKRKKSSFFLKK